MYWPKKRVGFEPGDLKGVCPLHGVTKAKRRREGAWPPRESGLARDVEYPPSPP